MTHVVLLLACAGVIYLACEWFVNAVEWLGERLGLGQTAVGSVLAAFGTALPESVVTLVAVTTGSTPDAKDIGVGAAMGGPLVLATVAYGVAGLVVLRRRHHGGPVVTGAAAARLAGDQAWFLPIFVVKVSLGLVAFAFKPVLGVLFFLAYAVYLLRELRAEEAEPGSDDVGREPLRLQPRRAVPTTAAVAVQTLVTLVVIFAASQLFVRQLDAVGPMLGLSGAVTALLLAPIATELPEILNAVIWVRQGKTTLALANVSGSMMIQATVPSGFAILFTSWQLDAPLLLAGVVTMVAVTFLLVSVRADRLTPRRLVAAGLGYLAFAAALVPVLA